MAYLLAITRPDGRTAERPYVTLQGVRREVVWTLTHKEFGISATAAARFALYLINGPVGVDVEHAVAGLTFRIDDVTAA